MARRPKQPGDASAADQICLPADVVYYAGEISMAGYYALSEKLDRYKSPGHGAAYVVPVTNGGDPHAGYRMARALGHHYPDDIRVLIPGVCKSAGTLMVIGGNELVISDRGELGPLDIQLTNKEEAFEHSSGLDIVQAVPLLQQYMLAAFRQYLIELKLGTGLGTKLASEIACKMATGLVAPIAAQIDPLRLGEHQRAMNIAVAYGERLNEKFNNSSLEQIQRLVVAYPVHGFVIDRKEATELFKRVRSPNSAEIAIMQMAMSKMVEFGVSPASPEAAVGVYSLERIFNIQTGMEKTNEEPNDSGVPAEGGVGINSKPTEQETD